MGYMSVTNSFTNGTSSDASQVNTNFTDVVNATSDGTKDFNINALTTTAGITCGTTVNSVKLTAGVLEYAGANTPGWLSNLGITYAAGVLTITDAQGAALSASNPGYVTVPSTTAGQMITLKVTSGGSFNDDAHASSDLTDLGFGITETANWASDMPFFLYVVNKGNTDLDGVDGHSMFFLSRSPCMMTTPSAANDIGDTGAIPVNDSQNVILIMANVTVADYTSLNCQVIGGLRMRWSTATDDWTVQALAANDGLGFTQLRKLFSTEWTMPIAQNGAAAGKYMWDNAGTAPVFTTNTIHYAISETGMCLVNIDLDGDGGTDGVGAVQARVSIPYTTYGSQSYFGHGREYAGGTGAFLQFVALANYCVGIFESTGNSLSNSEFVNGARTLVGSVQYKAF